MRSLAFGRSSFPTGVIRLQQVRAIERRDVPAYAVRVLQALVLDDPGSALLYALQDRPQSPRSRIDERVFDSRFVLDRVGPGHAIALDYANFGAVEVAGALQDLQRRRKVGRARDTGLIALA